MVEGDFYLQRQPHLTIETDVAFGYYDEEGRVTVQSKSISIHDHMAMIAEGLGLPMDKLRIIQNPTGATFGYKFSPTMEALIAVAVHGHRAARVRPLQREGAHLMHRQALAGVHQRARSAPTKTASSSALSTTSTVDHGPYSELGDITTTKTARRWARDTTSPTSAATCAPCARTTPTGVPFRSFGSVEVLSGLREPHGRTGREDRDGSAGAPLLNVYRPGSTTPHGSPPRGLFRSPRCSTCCGPNTRPRCKGQQSGVDSRCEEGRRHLARASSPVGSAGRTTPTVEVGAHQGRSHHLPLPGRTTARAPTWACWAPLTKPCGRSGSRPTRSNRSRNDTALVPKAGPAAASRQQMVTGNAHPSGVRDSSWRP